MSAPSSLPSDQNPSGPRAVLSVFDAVTIMVGLVVGVSIFRTPAIVAGFVDTESMFILVWVLGGMVTLIGALCYAELAASHPHSGGEYHFLSKAFGRETAVLFGWARCTVIQTGAIAAVAFMLGDYLAYLLPLGPYGPAIYAALSVVALTLVNILGTSSSKSLQIVVTFVEIGAIAAIILFGLLGAGSVPAQPASAPPAAPALGAAMIFVLLTYGGWNEASYLAGELKDAPRNIPRVLIIGTLILVTIYVLANLALLSILGLDGLRGADAVAADMMAAVAGPYGQILVTLAVIIAAIATLNASIFTGARAFYAMGRDVHVMRWIGHWNGRGNTPANGQLVQGALAIALIALGAGTPDGFKAMVDYTAPVFWLFLLLVGLAVFVLRWRHPGTVRPYTVPLYPITPIVFCATSAYMLYASVRYTGSAAWVGLAVLAAGVPLLFCRSESRAGGAQARSAAVTVIGESGSDQA